MGSRLKAVKDELGSYLNEDSNSSGDTHGKGTYIMAFKSIYGSIITGLRVYKKANLIEKIESLRWNAGLSKDSFFNFLTNQSILIFFIF